MLPKIFHDIMIDDYIEGGKFYHHSSGRVSGHCDSSVQDTLAEELADPDVLFSLSEFGNNGHLRIDQRNLNRMVEEHEMSVKALQWRLNLFNYLVITIYTLMTAIPVWFYLPLYEINFAVMIVLSWILFLVAMCKIRTTLKALPNTFTNEKVTLVHFVVLSLQAFFSAAYAVLYMIDYFDFN